MNRQVKVSILTPIYNHKAEYVRECLESLKNQIIQDIEFILIDNGATQESKEIIEEFAKKDNRFRIIHLAKNKGYGYAMNIGLKEAKGEFIGTVESDDFIDKNMFKELIDGILDNTVDIVKVSFRFHCEDKNECKVGRKFPEQKCNKIIKNTDILELPRGHASQWCAIYRKDMLLNNDIFYNETPGATHQDMPFVLKTWFFARNVVVFNKPLYFYRIDNPNQSTHQNNKTPWGSDKEYKLLNKFMEKKKDYMLPEYWYIKSWREFGNKTYFYKNQLTKKKLLYLILCMSNVFKKELKKGRVDFSYFTPEQAKEYLFIAKHPIKYYLKNKDWSKIYSKTKNETHSKIILFNIIKISYKRKSNKNHQINSLNDLIKLNLELKNQILDLKNKNEQIILMHNIQKEELNKQFAQMHNIQKEELNKQFAQMYNIQKEELNKQFAQMYNIQKEELNEQFAQMYVAMQAQMLHPKTFEQYKNAFNGKEVVLVCTGPTSKYYKPIKNAIHIGVNGAVYLNHINLDYLFVQDNTMYQPNNENLNIDINNYKPDTCKKFYGIIPNNHLSKIEKIIARIPLAYAHNKNVSQYVLTEQTCKNWAYDLSREPIANYFGTPFSAMQFILYANPSKIYLVGCDCSDGYAYNNQSNYISVKGQGKIWVDHVKPQIEKYHKNVEIISINPVGLKGLFNDIYTQDYIDNAQHQKEQNLNLV